VSKLGQNLGRLFEVGFNIGVLAYIEQNKLAHRFGNLYRQDLQQLSFPKILRRLADQEQVISQQHRQIVEQWSIFFLQKGFLSGLNFFSEYIKSTGWNQRQLKQLEILYYQCCCSDENSIGTYTKGREQVFRDSLSQFNNLAVDINKYSKKGEFLNADTLILIRRAKELRVLCVDYSVFSIKSIRDLVDVNNIEVLKQILYKEINYLKSKSVFANLGLDTKNSKLNLSESLARYYTAFKRQDKESVKMIQAASYAHSFSEFLSSQKLLTEETPVNFNVVGYSDRGISAMSLNRDRMDVLKTCYRIYKSESQDKQISETRLEVLKLIKRNAAKSFENGKDFIERILETSEERRTPIIHKETIKGFFNSIDKIPLKLAEQIKVSPNLDLREAHSELVQKALVSDATYIFLTGNPGIGKTTAIAEFLKSQSCLDEGFLFFYVSPRIQVNLDIIEKFKDRSTKTLCDDRLFAITTNATLIKNNNGQCTVNYLSNIHQEKQFIEQTVHFVNQLYKSAYKSLSSSGFKRLTEDCIQNVSQKSRGVLDSICEAIYTIINRELSNNIVATVALQSLKKIESEKDTLYHFEKIFKDAYNSREGMTIPSKMQKISGRIKHLFIAIDEITGDDSGVEFLNGISRILKTYGLTDSRYGFNTKIIVADASIVDPDIISQHLSETSAEPNKIFFRKTSGDRLPLSVQNFSFNNLKSVVINANSYPANSLDITYKVFVESVKFDESFCLKKKFKLEIEVQNQIVEDINKLLEQSCLGQVIVYVQNKNRLLELIKKIEECREQFRKYHDYLEIHASLSEQEKKQIHKYKERVKVIFMTASASRGLSFPKVKHILVDIPRFEIEKNLMEVIQVIYRGRGDKKLDSENKELIFYLSEQAIYYTDDRKLSLQESILSLLNILSILKTSIMTRIFGSGTIGRDNYMMIPIGGKSVLAAGQTFSGKMTTLIHQLKKEYYLRPNHKLLQEVSTDLEQLLSSVEIVLRNLPYSDEEQELSFLQLREFLSNKFIQSIHNSFDELLNFVPLQTGHISGSLLIVPLADRVVEEKYKMRLEHNNFIFSNENLLQQMFKIRNNPTFSESLRSAIDEAIALINLLKEQPNKTQKLEENSQYLDRYYAIPLFTFISSKAISQYFLSNEQESKDRRFRDLLALYIRSLYPVNNILPIGHKYKDFPFIVFRSYSLNELRSKIFTDKYFLTSNELNVLNLILAKD
jgi:hypothetical protein